MAKIIETKHWSTGNIMAMCIKHRLYTRGYVDSYDNMLSIVDKYPEPTNEAIYEVATDICEHSVANTIENIMFLISREAVDRFYEIEEA